MEDPRTTNRIEDLNRRLYARDDRLLQTRRPGALPKRTFEETKWQDGGRPPKKTLALPNTFFKKFFIGAVVFFVLAICFAGIRFFSGQGTVSNDNITIAIAGNSFVSGGDTLPMQVEVTNKNAVPLQLADLIIEYPKGDGGTDTGEYEHQRFSLGTIGGGKSVTEPVTLTLFGAEGSTKDIKATVEYRVDGSNAIFVKDTTTTVTIATSPLLLTVTGPDSTVTNQDVTFTMTLHSAAQSTSSHMVARVEYPFGFTFKNATPATSYGNNVWTLGDLKPNSDTVITITGTLTGDPGDSRAFLFSAGTEDATDRSLVGVRYNSVLHPVAITSPFLTTKILVGGKDDPAPVMRSGTQEQVQISYANTLTTGVSDVIIRAKLSGNALDLDSVAPSSGLYNSLTNEIVWDKSSEPALAAIGPGQIGFLSFTLKSKTAASGSSTAHPSIHIDLSVSGSVSDASAVVTNASNVVSKDIGIVTDLGLVAQASYYTGPFANSGPIPLQAEKPTTYTITWSLSNTANAVQNAEVKAVLPLQVQWLNVVTPTDEAVTYDAVTHTVDWNAGSVPPQTGFGNNKKSISFKVSVTPSKSQVGQTIQLISASTLTGLDSYANSVLQVTRPAMNTELQNDGAFPGGGGTVTP